MKLPRISLVMAALCCFISCTNPEITFTWKDNEALSHKAWRGERLFTEAILQTPEDLTGVAVNTTNLRSGFNVIDAGCVKAQFTRQVMADVLQDGYR